MFTALLHSRPKEKSAQESAHPLRTENAESVRKTSEKMRAVCSRVSEVIWDKEAAIEVLVAALFSGGHVLLEDTPGVGKTTLAQALSMALGLEYKRIQFTADLLPGDITGSSIYNRDKGAFEFQPGPVFTQILLADEINRASPKAQSALLQAMEERKVTVDGITHKLPAPFLVIATQNPVNHSGVHELPESQLDRFALSISLGYPGERAEMAMLMGGNPRHKLETLSPVMTSEDFAATVQCATSVNVSQALAQYVYAITQKTRDPGLFTVGLSPRSVMNLISTAQALALMRGRDYVLPDDIKTLFPWVASQRLSPLNEPGVRRGPSSAPFHARWMKDIPSEG